jgi:hypothetical protein
MHRTPKRFLFLIESPPYQEKTKKPLCALRAFAVQLPAFTATDVAKHLGIRQTSVLKSVKKGNILCDRVGLQT